MHKFYLRFASVLIILTLSPYHSFALPEKIYIPISQPVGYKVTMASLSPAGLGENQWDILLVDGAGKPVQDAQVTLTARMPSMKMSTDKKISNTKNKSEGHYAGKTYFSMEGKWQVTVHIQKGKQPESVALFEFNPKWE